LRARRAWRVPRADRGRREPARSLGLFGLLCLAAAAWLLFPRPRGGPDGLPALRCVVVDASAVVRRRAVGYAGHLTRLAQREAARAREEGSELGFVLYSGGASWWSSPASPEDFLVRLAGGDVPLPRIEESAHSDLAAGLELARAALLAPGRAPGSLLVVGDGTATGSDPAALLDELGLQGIALTFERLPAATWPDARLHEVRLPSAVEVGAPLAAAVIWSVGAGGDGHARWSAETELGLHLELRDARGQRTLARQLDWPTDDALQRTLIELGTAAEGAVLLDAQLSLRGPGALNAGDPVPENDHARATARVGSARIALALAPADQLAALREWLDGATPGIDWIVRAPGQEASAPQDVDLICTFDLAPDEWPVARIEAVLARGGGWLRAGGWKWLASARSAGAERLAKLSPLGPADPEGPPVERLFLVDGSGSMRGEPFAAVRTAIEGILPMVPDRDRIVLRLFSSTLDRPVVLAEAGEAAGAQSLARLRATEVPGGATQILSCLDIVARERIAPPAQRGTVLLLSDGREEALNVEEHAERLRAALRGTRRELSALAAGPDADVWFLETLVGPDGRLLRAEDFSGLDELFREEVGGERLLEGADALALPAEPAGSGMARELSVAFGEPLALERAVICERRPATDVLLTSEDGTPLLAIGRVGGGVAAALATNPGAGWGGELVARDLAPLMRALARGSSAEPTLAARIVRDSLIIEGFDGEAPAVVTVQLWREDGAPEVIGLAVRVRLGELELRAPFAASGRDLSATREALMPGELVAELAAGKLVLRGANPAFVIPVAGSGGAAFLPEARRAYFAPHAGVTDGAVRRVSRSPHPAGVWLLALGLLAVFGNVLARLLQTRDEEQQPA